MQVILLVVVGAINQSKYMPMMSLAVVGTLTNQILLVYMGVYAGLCGGLHGSTWVYAGVFMGLCGGLCGSTWVYAGLHVGLCGSTWVYMGVYMGLCGDFSNRWSGKNQDFRLIRLFNVSDLIGCGWGH